MIIDWSGQHLYVDDYNVWAYNPYGIEEQIYIPTVLTWYGDVFDGFRPDIFANVYADSKYHDEHRPDIYQQVNVPPPLYANKQDPTIQTDAVCAEFSAGQKPVINANALHVEYDKGHRPIIKKL